MIPHLIFRLSVFRRMQIIKLKRALRNKPEINLIIGELLITPDETLRKKLYVNLWKPYGASGIYSVDLCPYQSRVFQ